MASFEDSCERASSRRTVPASEHTASPDASRNSAQSERGSVLPTSASDLLPSRLASKIEEIVESPSDNPADKLLQVAGAVPDLAGVALAPRFAGEVCTIMGGIEGISRSSAGTAVGILIAPILAVSKFARLMGVEFTPQSLGLSEPDHYHSPATAAARLDSLELRRVKETQDDGSEEERAAEEEVTCAVCQCDFEDGEYGLVFRHCKHAFHPKCLNTWLDRRHTCPCCRESVLPEPESRKARRPFDSVRFAFRSREGRRGSAPAAGGRGSTLLRNGGRFERSVQEGDGAEEGSSLDAGDEVEPGQEMETGDVVEEPQEADEALDDSDEAASGRFIFF